MGHQTPDDNFTQVADRLLHWSDSLPNTGKHLSYREARNKQPNNKKIQTATKTGGSMKVDI